MQNKSMKTGSKYESEITAVNFEDFNEYYRKNYLIFYNENNQLSAAVVDPKSTNYIKRKFRGPVNFYQIEQRELIPILERSFSESNTLKTQNYLSEISSFPNAKTINYRKMVVGFSIIFTSCLFLLSNVFNLLNNIIYLSQNILKLLLFRRSIAKDANAYIINGKYSGKLPIYTVFVPLYKEVRKLKSIIKAINQLEYPKSKLDVKFIIEADDKDMIKALAILRLPSYIHVIKVPYSLPRTKPKAMNYATAYIKGEFLCIYDAEDKPAPDQLLKALQAFKNLPEEYACLQARLNYYNANENLITKFFSIEYSLWFEYLIKGLSLYNLPLPLGGTSNHFKVSALKNVGYWDSYNVTEDADLGVRLFFHGYKIHIIDSETLEEAPITLDNWLAQRARWIKGYLQTFYIFLLRPKSYKEFGFYNIYSVYIFVGFTSYSFICMPWLMIIFLFKLNIYIYYLWFINTIFGLAYMYSVIYYISKKKTFAVLSNLILLIWPLYFVLHTIAAYKAVFEVFVSPFKWNKTRHGVSAQELD